MSKIEEIFDFLIKEGKVELLDGHVILTKEEIIWKEYNQYNNSYNHTTKGCWALRTIIQDSIDKFVLKFPTTETMVIDEDPFLVIVGIVGVDLRD